MSTPLETPSDRVEPAAADEAGRDEAINQFDLFEAALVPLASQNASAAADTAWPEPSMFPAITRPLDQHIGEPIGHATPEAAEAPPETTDEPDALSGDHAERRLQETIRWLQMESMRRLPRAPTLPPVAGLPPIPDDVDAQVYGRFVEAAPPPSSLAPERMRPAPRQSRGGLLRGLSRLLLASAVAAPLAYYVALDGVPPADEDAGTPQLASSDMRLVTLAPRPEPQPASSSSQGKLQDSAADRSTTSQGVSRAFAPIPAAGVAPGPAIDTAPAGAAAAPETATTPAVQPEAVAPVTKPEGDAGEGRAEAIPTAAPARPAAVPEQAVARPTGALAPQDIKFIIERGRQFFELGDVAAARLLFRRAANAGDAAAAIAMGTTYDPVVLGQRGVKGVSADLYQARSWYEKAREMGSPEGPRRLEMLANR